jgi:CDP-diacylglycerol--inositol 3-phosphatidyltransferase
MPRPAPIPLEMRKLERRRRESDVVDAKLAVDLATAQTYDENVFLFLPNIIGKRYFVIPSSACSNFNRIYSCDSCGAVDTLYENPPENVHPVVWHILPFGRSGWSSRPSTGPDLQVWCRSRHGHGSVSFVRVCVTGRLSTLVRQRCTTACLLCYLSSAYTDWALLFQFLITLDFSSHYMHMYRCVSGAAAYSSGLILRR